MPAFNEKFTINILNKIDQKVFIYLVRDIGMIRGNYKGWKALKATLSQHILQENCIVVKHCLDCFQQDVSFGKFKDLENVYWPGNKRKTSGKRFEWKNKSM